jgi:membrane-associated phospholipid phosphatase
MRPPAAPAIPVGFGARAGILRQSGRLQALLFFATFVLYRIAYGLTAAPGGIAREHGGSILSAERALRVAVEPDLQRAFDPLVGVFTGVYLCAQLLVIWLVLAWCLRRSRPVYRKLRAAVLGSWIAGIACFAAWPAAPPRFVDGAGVSNSLADAFGNGAERATAVYNPYAAMPSLHCAFALLAGIALWRSTRGWWRLLGVLWPAAVGLATVVTGNHWVLDVLAGWALAGAAWFAVASADRVRSSRRSARV